MKRIFNKKILLILPATLLLLVGIYYFAVYNQVKPLKLECSYIGYNTSDDLIKNSDLILVVSTDIPVTKRDFEFRYIDGGISDFYTLTQVTIKKIIKQPSDFKYTVGNKIKILEPFAIEQTPSGKLLLTDAEYAPLLTDKDYLIFTKKNDKGTYCIINMDLGAYNITDNENQIDNKYLITSSDNSNEIKNRKEKYLNLKKDIARELNIPIKEN